MNTQSSSSASSDDTNPFIKLYKECIAARPRAVRRPMVLEDARGDVYVELGMHMPMSLVRTSYPSAVVLRTNPDAVVYEVVPQVTIRDIRLPKHLQRRGYLWGFVRFLLRQPHVEAVQLEAVLTEWLKDKLENSDEWVRQTPPEYMQFNPTYATFRKTRKALDE